MQSDIVLAGVNDIPGVAIQMNAGQAGQFAQPVGGQTGPAGQRSYMIILVDENQLVWVVLPRQAVCRFLFRLHLCIRTAFSAEACCSGFRNAGQARPHDYSVVAAEVVADQCRLLFAQ